MMKNQQSIPKHNIVHDNLQTELGMSTEYPSPYSVNPDSQNTSRKQETSQKKTRAAIHSNPSSYHERDKHS